MHAACGDKEWFDLPLRVLKYVLFRTIGDFELINRFLSTAPHSVPTLHVASRCSYHYYGGGRHVSANTVRVLRMTCERARSLRT